jgi:hypothetical protein
MNTKNFIILIFQALIVMACSVKEQSSGFAIVIDKTSYDKAKTEVDAYACSIEQQGLKTYIIIDKWHHPDSIKEKLKNLYTKPNAPIEGAVFIGDIPVPMLRNAQHLTSAFKMDQEKYPWNRSSVPSDRFYDDFDLQFTFLKQDTARSLYFYYDLAPESPQQLSVDIYTARIKPMEGDDKYEQLKAYLKKVVAYKANPGKAEQVMFFTGHGYNSESPRSWMDEKLALNQQFNYLQGQQNFLEYFNFHYDEHVKFRLMAELQRKNLDIALLHHHGGPTAQYLDGMPENQSIQDHIKSVKYYLRSKLRPYTGKSPVKINKTKQKYSRWLDVPDSWFNGAFEEEQTRKDSIYNANLDIYIEDFDGNYTPNARFIMLDACFTGSFHRKQYLAGKYIFNQGQTIITQANSVNAFQDKWPDEMVGLLGLGLRTGLWHKMNCSLETHLIGDPTFAFKIPDDQPNINNAIIFANAQKPNQQKLLSSPVPDVQALALRMIFENKGTNASDLLFKYFKNSKYYTVRAEAFKLLTFCRDSNYLKAINLGINDSYELIQRLSAIQMAKSGHPSHIPFIIDALLRNNVPKRVEYNLRNALKVYDQKQLLAELEKQIPLNEYLLNKDRAKTVVSKLITTQTNSSKKYVEELLSKESSIKEKYFNIRSFRNNNVHQYLPDLINYIDTVSDQKLKHAGIEMLGWFHFSYRRNDIIEFCNKIIADTTQQNKYIKEEAVRTKNRLKG